MLTSMIDISQMNAETMISLIEAGGETPGLLDEIKLWKSKIIPGHTRITIKCKTKRLIEGNEKLVLFTPEVGENLDEVEISESLGLLKRGKSPFITVSVYNTSAKSVYLKKGTILGYTHDVSAVIPVDLEKRDVDVKEINSGSKNEMLSKIDLNHLPEKKQSLVKKMLREEADVFALTKNDIGDVPGFEMEIKFVDNFPVSEPYRRIPTPFYEEVKTHITDLLINGWIQKSYSSFSSPMVCVRKKNGEMRLCIDYRKVNLKTIPDRQPLPRVQDILDGLFGQAWFTTLDMSQAYHQGYMHKKS